MAIRRRDARTIDMFAEFEPRPVVDRFDGDRVRAATLSVRVARAVSECLKDAGRDRTVIAAEISDYLGESVTRAMLDAYASPGREAHNIPAHRLMALAAVTRDARPINALLFESDMIAVDARYEALIRREQAREMREKLDREIDAADAQWKAGRR
jgi:hypothetical protein